MATSAQPAQPVTLVTTASHLSTGNKTQSAAPSRSVSSDDIIIWSVRGTRDDVIIQRIEHSGTVFHLSAAEENHLRDAGVTDEVIRAMKATAWN